MRVKGLFFELYYLNFIQNKMNGIQYKKLVLDSLSAFIKSIAEMLLR